MADQKTIWKELGAQLRIDSIRCTTAAGSGHPTSSMSAADLMAVLLEKYLHFDWANPLLATNDRLIFSKGHACPLLYSMFKAAGAVTDAELLTLRKFGSRLEGHPNPHVLPLVDVATGSLGQGLPIGIGMALNGKYLDRLAYRVWVVLGDSEMAEGSIWEAFDKASYYKLDNLIAILDMNRLGQRGETDLGWNSAPTPLAQSFRLACHRAEWARCVRHRRRLCRGAGAEGSADVPGGEDGEGPRCFVPGQQGRLARQGPRRRAGQKSYRRVGRQAASRRHHAKARRRHYPLRCRLPKGARNCPHIK